MNLRHYSLLALFSIIALLLPSSALAGTLSECQTYGGIRICGSYYCCNLLGGLDTVCITDYGAACTGGGFDMDCDSTPPIGSLLDVPASWQDYDASITLSCSDPGSGCNPGADYFDIVNTGSSCTYTTAYTADVTVDSHKKFCWKVTDNQANTAQGSSIIRVDKTDPINSMVINNDDIYTKDLAVTLTPITYSDSGGSGVDECRYHYGTWSDWEPCVTSKPFTITTPDGTKTVTHQVRDNAGNTRNAQDSIVLDQTPPSITNCGPVSEMTGNPTISCDVTETYPYGCKMDVNDIDYSSMLWTCTAGSGVVDCVPTHDSRSAPEQDLYTMEAYYIKCRDQINNVGFTTHNYYYSETPVSPPAPTGFSPASGSYTSSTTPTVTFNMDKPGDCLAHTSDLSYNDMAAQSNEIVCTGTHPGQFSCAMSLGSDGTKNVYISCKDVIDNKDTAASNNDLSYLLDTAPPQITAAGPTTYQTSSSVTLTAETNENAYCRYSTTSQGYTSMPNQFTVGEGTTSHSKTLTLPDNPYNYYISCTDTLNPMTTSSPVSFTVDTVTPTTSDNAQAGWQTAAVAITLTPIDAAPSSGFAMTRYCIDTTNTCIPETEGTDYTVPVPIPNQGRSYFRYNSKDNAGNTQTIVSKPIDIDLVAPTYVSYSVSGCDYTSGSDCWVKAGTTTTHKIKHTDATSTPFKQYLTFAKDGCSPNNCPANNEIKSYISVDSGSFTDWMVNNAYMDITSAACVGSCTGTTAEENWQVTTGTTEGSFKVWTFLYDQASLGLGYTYVSRWYKIDTQTPTTTDDAPVGWQSAQIAVTLTPSDSALSSGFAWTKYCTDTTNTCTPSTVYSDPISISTEDVSYIRYHSQDNVGNTESVKGKTIYIDTTQPSATITIDSGADSTNALAVTLTSTYSDASSGIYACRYKNAGDSWTLWQVCSASDPWTLPAGDGTKTVYYEVKDNVGNVNQVTDAITLDQTDPVITNCGPTADLTGTPTITCDVTETNPLGCKMDINNVAYDSMPWTCSAGSGSVSCTRSGSTQTLYTLATYYLKCKDLAANSGSATHNYYYSLTPVSPPEPSNFAPASGSITPTPSQTITFDLDKPGDCLAYLNEDLSYDDMAARADETICTGTYPGQFSCAMSLGSDGTKNIHISCNDEIDNKDDTATNADLAYTVDTAPPVRSNGQPSTLVITSSTALSLTTNEQATCRYSTTSGISYDSMVSTTTALGTSHSWSITGLIDGIKYYYLRCKDVANNKNNNDFTIIFTVNIPEICDNLADDDGNTLIDCVDPDCTAIGTGPNGGLCCSTSNQCIPAEKCDAPSNECINAKIGYDASCCLDYAECYTLLNHPEGQVCFPELSPAVCPPPTDTCFQDDSCDFSQCTCPSHDIFTLIEGCLSSGEKCKGICSSACSAIGR